MSDKKIIKCVILTESIVEHLKRLSPRNHSRLIRLILKKYFDNQVI